MTMMKCQFSNECFLLKKPTTSKNGELFNDFDVIQFANECFLLKKPTTSRNGELCVDFDVMSVCK